MIWTAMRGRRWGEYTHYSPSAAGERTVDNKLMTYHPRPTITYFPIASIMYACLLHSRRHLRPTLPPSQRALQGQNFLL
eukprot:scaffold428765_cov14-Prasinocladus_malaysianus.AAC.1